MVKVKGTWMEDGIIMLPSELMLHPDIPYPTGTDIQG